MEGIFAFYWIRKYYPDAVCSSKKLPGTGRPVLWTGQEDVSGHLVVLEGKDLQAIGGYYKNTVFVCPSEKEFLSVHQNAVIFLKEQAGLAAVMNKVLEIWDLYEEWIKKLDQAVNRQHSYTALIESCSSLVEDPLALLDKQFRYVGYSKNLACENGYEEKYVDPQMYLPLEDINYLKAMPDFKKLEKIQETFQYICIENILHKNVYSKQEYIGRMAIPSSSDPVKEEYYRCILTISARYIELLYQKLGTFHMRKPSDSRWKQIIARLLEGREAEPDILDRVLENLGYSQNDQFYLLQFRSRLPQQENMLGESLAGNMETMWPGTACLVYPIRILAMVNYTRYQKATGKTFTQELAYFLRESLLSAGISRCFRSLSFMRAAEKQTEIALETGLLLDSTYWYFRFDDYAYWHLLHRGCGDFLPEQICSPILLVLQEYDARQHTELNKTLCVYMKHQYNALSAARELCVARSTFLKRMERIHKLTGLNLEDWGQRVYLEVSYELYRFQNAESKRENP